MTLCDLEFSIAQYADGTLPADQRAALEAVLAADESARATLEAYRKLDAALAEDRAARPVAVRWDRLAERISTDVARHAEAGQAIPEELEYALAQHADGSLSADERDALEAELSANPACRLLLADYAALDAALKATAALLPTVRWDRLAEEISAAVAREAEAEQVEVAGRIEPAERAAERAESYPIFGWLRSPMRLAVAASVLLAASVGIVVLRSKSDPVQPIQVVTRPPVTVVEGPLAEAAKGEAVEAITIGPPPDRTEFATGFTDDMITRPSRSYVASGARPARPASDDDVALSPWAQ